ncbi:MAG: sigma-54 dependent transcriptional regulator [Candidatus Hydrogenedentota bacterium]
MVTIAPQLSRDAELAHGPLHESLVGQSDFIKEVDDLVFRLADSNLTVLVTGETGTGKDIVARLLHRRSGRNGKPFVKVNCPALPSELLESELFGYEKGAFTGARAPKPGRFELADKGTIFLDEIGAIPENVQVKLMQVLDGEPFMRIGGSKPVKTNTRIVAATNVQLDKAVVGGRLRQDIAFRLGEFVIHMRPLRERVEDIPLLADHFNFNFSAGLEREYRPISDVTVGLMRQLPWRGNIRELAARVKEYVATGQDRVLVEERYARTESNSATAPNGTNGRDRHFLSLKEAARQAIEMAERTLIEEALRYTLWNRRKAAKLLKVSYSSLLRRIDSYQIGKS